MFGRRKSHPNYRKPIKLKYRPSPAVIAAAAAAAAVAALVVYILFFNKGKSDPDKNTLQESNGSNVNNDTAEPVVPEKKDYTEQAKKAADGFMSEFCRLDFEGMSEYCSKDIAKMMGYPDFESYVDGQFENIQDGKLKDVYSEVADIIVDCAENNMSYIVNGSEAKNEKYVFDVTLTVPEYWDEVIDGLSVSERQKIARQVTEESRDELEKTEAEERERILEEKIYDKAVENIREICREPETENVDGKLTVIKKNGKWVVDVDNSDLRLFINSLVGVG